MSSASAGVKVTFDKPFLLYNLEEGPPQETIVRCAAEPGVTL